MADFLWHHISHNWPMGACSGLIIADLYDMEQGHFCQVIPISSAVHPFINVCYPI